MKGKKVAGIFGLCDYVMRSLWRRGVSLSFDYVSMDPEPIKTSVSRVSVVRLHPQLDDLVRLIDFGALHREVLKAWGILVGGVIVAAKQRRVLVSFR